MLTRLLRMQARHRVRFLQLADVFLASGMVPAYTAAAFAKRFARLALRAPPAGGDTRAKMEKVRTKRKEKEKKIELTFL